MLDSAKFTDILWEALKQQACVHPDKAYRIVILNRSDVVAAVKQVKKKIDERKE